MNSSKDLVKNNDQTEEITTEGEEEEEEENIRNYLNKQNKSQHTISFLTATSEHNTIATTDACEWIECNNERDTSRWSELTHCLTTSAKNLYDSYLTKRNSNTPASIISYIKNEAEQVATSSTTNKSTEEEQTESENYNLNIILGNPLPASFEEKLVFGKYCCDETKTYAECPGHAADITSNMGPSTNTEGGKKAIFARSVYTIAKPAKTSHEQLIRQRDTVNDFYEAMRKLTFRDSDDDVDPMEFAQTHDK